jgi:very-short-patch-repair endonuclease
MKTKIIQDVLIAIMNNKKDFAIAMNRNWYRIPVDHAPLNVRNKEVKYLGFYHTKVFKEYAFSIRWVGKVNKIEIVKRRELFPDDVENSKSDNEYYKISFKNLKELKTPIISNRPRRILFIPTDKAHLDNAREINEIFFGSPIEEKLWHSFRKEKIDAEREYLIENRDGLFWLDFALFTKLKQINIECDGDAYHTDKQAVKYDKKRNNILESFGWHILRYTTDEIQHNMEDLLNQVKHIINIHGGLEDLDNEKSYKFFSDWKGQTEMF